MFLKSLKTSTYFSSFISKKAYSVAYTPPTKPIDVTIRRDILSFTFRLSGEQPMNFFVSKSMPFKNLREIIQAQYQNADIEYDFSGVNKSRPIDEDTNIIDFLNSDVAGKVKIEINQDTFVLQNLKSEPLSQIILPAIEESTKDPKSVVHWYAKCIENKLQPSTSGPLSYFLKNFNSELTRFQGKGKISEKEIEAAVQKAVLFGSDPINKKMEEVTHEINVLTSQIKELDSEKNYIEDKAERRINLYLKLILLATLVQGVGFYYAIFHVDWLGWDIIEPITYTVQSLTVFLGLRFYLKYGLGRDLQTIRHLHRNKFIDKNRVVKARYDLICKQLLHKQAQRNVLQLQNELYLNRRNYYQFNKVHEMNFA